MISLIILLVNKLLYSNYNIEVQFEIVTGTSELANIPVEGLF
jgi:hypothetical protein